jgi:DNA-binding MarR family transcriptional regulator
MFDGNNFLESLKNWVEASTHRSIHAFLRHNRDSDLSHSQIGSLFRLYHHGASPINDLADHLGITMAAVSQLLNPLIDLDLIFRSTDPDDRRVKLITLTEKGKETVQKSIRSRTAWVGDLAEQFSPQEKELIMPALEIMYGHLLDYLAIKDPNCFRSHDPKTKEDR